MATVSDKAIPKIIIVRILPSASGFLPTASTALLAAIPSPIPVPKPAHTARPAAIAIKPFYHNFFPPKK